jgi:Arc/MetJ family transcription regulator
MEDAMPEVRTNIVLDEDLVAEAQGVTGLATKRDVVDFALRELVRQRRRGKLNVLDLAGQIEFIEDCDPKADWDRKL